MARRSSYSTGGKTVLVIFAAIIMGLLVFCGVWTVKNWNKVKDGLSGADLYTQEDLKEAYNDGYTAGIGDKDSLLNALEEKNATIAALQEELLSMQELSMENEKLKTNNALYYSQIQTNYSRIDQLKEDSNSNIELITELIDEIIVLQNTIKDNEAKIEAREKTIETYEAGLNGIKIDEAHFATFVIDDAVVAFEVVGTGASAVNIPESVENEYIINSWSATTKNADGETIEIEDVDVSTFAISTNTVFRANITKYHTITFYNAYMEVVSSVRQLATDEIVLPAYFTSMPEAVRECQDGFYVPEINKLAASRYSLEALNGKVDRDISIYPYYDIAVQLHYDSYDSTMVETEYVSYSCYAGFFGSTFTKQQMNMLWGTGFNAEEYIKLTGPDKYNYYEDFVVDGEVHLYRLSQGDICSATFILKPGDKGSYTLYAEKGDKLVDLERTFRYHADMPDPVAFIYDEGIFIPISALKDMPLLYNMTFEAVYAVDVEFVFAEDDVVTTTDDALCIIYAGGDGYYNANLPEEHVERINASTWSLTPNGEAVTLEKLDWLKEQNNSQDGKVRLYLVD